MPRKYEDIHVCPSGDHGSVHWNCTCDAGEGERVTAVDMRDLIPFVAAVHGALVRTVDDRTRDELTAALKAFEEDS